MKILYAIQGTGNGHVSRAREIIPHLLNYGKLDLLVSGRQMDIELPMEVRYNIPGLGFVFGKTGGISYWGSLKAARPARFLRDVMRFPVEDYDFIINDFEPVTAWAARRKGIPCFSLSHQASFLSPKAPRPEKRDAFAEAIFKHYAPTSGHIGFHFERYDKFIEFPVIRQEVRQLEPTVGGHISVYLPSYGNEVLRKFLSRITDVRWEVFSKHAKRTEQAGNVTINPISNDGYLKSLEGARGVLAGAGFESTAETLHLGKMLMVIPMANQYEQICNAEALKRLGVASVPRIREDFTDHLKNWLSADKPTQIVYPDDIAEIVDRAVISATRAARDGAPLTEDAPNPESGTNETR